MASAVLKIVLLLITGVSTHISLSPPNPPAARREKAGQRTVFEHWVLWITWLSKTFVWMAVSLDAPTTIFVSSMCSANATQNVSFVVRDAYCPSAPVVKRLSSVSPVLFVGALLSLGGALLRWRCFHELGELFTFEITIRPKHVLVTTGPYGWVRHPAYVGVYGSLIGASLVLFPRGSFIWEYGFQRPLTALQQCYTHSTSAFNFTEVSQSIVRCSAKTVWGINLHEVLLILCASFWLFKIYFALNSTNKRLTSEDTELRKRFGLEWERYASVVQWKLIPGII